MWVIILSLLALVPICAIVYAYYFLGSSEKVTVFGKTYTDSFCNLDGVGFAFLKDNLAEHESILIKGKFRLSHILPSFTYFCIMVVLDLLISGLITLAVVKELIDLNNILQFNYRDLFQYSYKGLCLIFIVLIIIESLWASLIRFINRRKSEFIITSERFAIRKFQSGSCVVCRFNWRDFQSAKLYHGVLDSILRNYTLRLTFATYTEESAPQMTHIDICYLRDAKSVKAKIDSLAKEWNKKNEKPFE